MKPIVELAFVRTGYTYRGSLKYAHKGDTIIVQTADASEKALAKPEILARADLRRIDERYILRDGDLIMRSRGVDNSSFLITNPPERMICIAPLHFLRVADRNKLLPAYLHWFLNLATVQAAFYENALVTVSGARYVRVRDVANLMMPLPSIERQQDIVAYYGQEQESYTKVEDVNKARLLRVERWLLHELHTSQQKNLRAL